MNVHDLEKHMIPFEEGLEKLRKIDPQEANNVLLTAEQGYPIGFAYTEETGLAVLCSGQGPFIAWQEKEFHVEPVI